MIKANSTAITEQWLGGISYEVAFWNNVYRWPHTFQGLMSWAHYGSVISLEGFDANAFLLTQDHPKVYDVGAGLSYAVGDHLDKEGELIPLDIHYMDPLANYFNRILKKYKKTLPAVEFGMTEYLSAFIPGDASLITIQNALDHSSSPIKGIVEALVALREGGVLYLNHHPNEAETEHYKGFHQYNIDETAGELVIWNQSEKIYVGRLLGAFASVETKRMDNGHIVSIIRKQGDDVSMPAPLCKYVDHQADKAELCEVLLRYQFHNTSLVKNMNNSFRFGMFNVVQFLAQMLPWNLKMKVKRLIKQA